MILLHIFTSSWENGTEIIFIKFMDDMKQRGEVERPEIATVQTGHKRLGN